MSDRATRWQHDFQKARGTASQLQAELQRWELLGAQQQGVQTSAAQRGERSKQGAVVRGKIMTLKLDIERLHRELEALKASGAPNGVTQKSITQFSDDLERLGVEFRDLQERSRGSTTPAAQVAPAGTMDSSLARMPSPVGSSGAELQPVSNVQMLQQQRQALKDLEEPLAGLEGSVANLQQVSNMIGTEIRAQNEMLDAQNEAFDRTNGRMSRTRQLMSLVNARDRNRYLTCVIFLMLGILVALFIYTVAP